VAHPPSPPTRPHPPPSPPPPLPYDAIYELNRNPVLDFQHQYNRLYNDENLDDDPYSNFNIASKFHDLNSISHLCANGQPIYISLNIQSLNSKFEEFKQFIIELQLKNVIIDVIALQETWEIQFSDLLTIPGFQTIVYKNRRGMRGGGVGFYVKDGLNFKIVNELSPFEEKIFESLTIQLSYPGKQPILLTTGYRSNGTIANVTQNQQIERFFTVFDELLHKISRKNLSSYIFLDSNFDLLSLHDVGSSAFLNSVLAAGYLQCIFKATRMQNNSRTLLDQILVSCHRTSFETGTIITDLSDHFPTFSF
jgi:exonuclease III